MIARRYALLIPATMLVACAGGSTMRVVDDDNADNGPVALAPAPEAGPDSTAAAAPVAAAPPSTATEPEASAAPATADSTQGYAPYGNSSDLAIRRIGQWTHTGISEARRLIIRDANAWAAFWSELGVGDRPSVDFSRDLVIAVAAGQRPSGGHEIAVTRVTENKGELQVEVVEISPGPNCMTTSSLTQPVDVVVVPGVTTRSWSFTERKEVRGCR
jgi:hypothetical protein